MDRSKMGASSFPTDRQTYIQTAAEQKYLIMEWRSLTPGRAQRRASDERHTHCCPEINLFPPRKKNLPFFCRHQRCCLGDERGGGEKLGLGDSLSVYKEEEEEESQKGGARTDGNFS